MLNQSIGGFAICDLVLTNLQVDSLGPEVYIACPFHADNTPRTQIFKMYVKCTIRFLAVTFRAATFD